VPEYDKKNDTYEYSAGYVEEFELGQNSEASHSQIWKVQPTQGDQRECLTRERAYNDSTGHWRSAISIGTCIYSIRTAVYKTKSNLLIFRTCKVRKTHVFGRKGGLACPCRMDSRATS
jgi:hypothetical protein